MEFLQSIDLLRAMMIWGPSFFTLLLGIVILLFTNKGVRVLAFVIPSFWATLALIGVIIENESNQADEALVEAMMYQMFGLLVVALILGFILAILATFSPRTNSADSQPN